MRGRVAWAALLAMAPIALGGLTASAHAQLTGTFTVFQQCPRTNAETSRCLYVVVEGGEVAIGSKKVSVVNPVIIQGGSTKQVEFFSHLVGAADGVTISKTSQPVPGGLLAMVPPAGSSPLVKALSSFFSKSGLNRVNSTMELARPANEVQLSESNLSGVEGVAMQLPVKVHLENPFLGRSCYIGSSGSPIMLELTTGTTNPPPPNQPISGTAGDVTFFEGGSIMRMEGSELLDNAWSAPRATGCGGPIGFLLNPVINSQLGLPLAPGYNSVILKSTVMVATAVAVNRNDKEHP